MAAPKDVSSLPGSLSGMSIPAAQTANDNSGDRQVNEMCLELLNIEAVDLLLRLSVDLQQSTQPSSTKDKDAKQPSATESATAVREQDREAAFIKLDAIGFQIGLRLAERHSSDLSRFVDTMDMVKFICKDLWTLMFKKPADNLKTNHKGTFVLQDNTFRWFSRMSSAESDALARARLYAAIPSGIIRGVLHNLGVSCTVTVEVTALPQCSFKIVAIKS